MLYDYVFHILYRLYKILRISYLGHSSRKPVSGEGRGRYEQKDMAGRNQEGAGLQKCS